VSGISFVVIVVFCFSSFANIVHKSDTSINWKLNIW